MKKIVIVMSMFFAFNSALSEGLAEPLLTLTYSDRQCLEALYWHDSMGFLDNQLSTINVDYYLQVLPKHIKELEESLTVKRSGWTSPEIVTGAFFALATAVFVKLAIIPELYALMNGKFKSVEMPDSMLNNLAAVSFTDVEKRKLERLSIEKIYLSPLKYWTSSQYSQEESEKIILLGRRLANRQAKAGLFFSSMCSAMMACFSGLFFYQAAHHVENTNKRITDELERAKRLFETLTVEKISRSY
jgi:hypothetical protein